ncbi:hypothetical protein TH53_19980 [Pedobacter lusitanus]|uniref:Contig97, whole genome shotgun sequence n=1 Tax=Pedobacter lusitanus TaxID=1503925 RepID=A0A0D0FSW0_9SPHI|nr:DUF6624 domain-containing protein [Pedobacter lusitanus]KIO75534.1 hypothetical protein TH53_19980 [Pedobacter lusitanus]
MKTIFVSLLTVISISCFAQKPVNVELKKQLDTILRTDQGIREFLDSEVKEERKDAIAQLLNYPRTVLDKSASRIMRKIDSINIEKVERIITKYGYPGKTLVGEPENTAVFYAIQHSNKIPKYYQLIEKAGKAKELPYKYTAMMLDRKLTGEGKEQVYGTQVYMEMINNPKTGKKEPFEYVMPIKDAKNVNKRRKEAGFDSTVEENALRLGVVYKEYTKEQIREITKQ